MDNIVPWGACCAVTIIAMGAGSYSQHLEKEVEVLQIQGQQCNEELNETELKFETYQHAIKDYH